MGIEVLRCAATPEHGNEDMIFVRHRLTYLYL